MHLLSRNESSLFLSSVTGRTRKQKTPPLGGGTEAITSSPLQNGNTYVYVRRVRPTIPYRTNFWPCNQVKFRRSAQQGMTAGGPEHMTGAACRPRFDRSEVCQRKRFNATRNNYAIPTVAGRLRGVGGCGGRRTDRASVVSGQGWPSVGGGRYFQRLAERL